MNDLAEREELSGTGETPIETPAPNGYWGTQPYHTPALRRMLETRMKEYLENPDDVVSWEEVRAGIKAQFGWSLDETDDDDDA